MEGARVWVICRIGYTETLRALAMAAGARAASPRCFRDEWPLFSVIDVDQELVETAAELAVDESLRTLDALHLASALVLPGADRILATWDERLWSAAESRGVRLLPARL